MTTQGQSARRECNTGAKQCIREWKNLPPPTGDEREILQLQYETAVELVMHEDKQNYVKFHNFMYVTVGLLAIIGLSLKPKADQTTMTHIVPLAVSVIGLMFAHGFGLELKSGVICITCHRAVVDEAEERLIGPTTGIPTLRSKPERKLLRAAPLAIMIMWLLLIIVQAWIWIAP